MLIRSVTMDGFFGISDVVSFPLRGILKTTAPNGSGKTARLLEAPAWAGWGKTLRKTPPTPHGSSGVIASVSLCTDKVEVRRSTKKSERLSWRWAGEASPIYETNTKGDDELERVLGDQLTWRRTHIFDSSDADLFSNATDGDRKRLLEHLVGVTAFDSAYKVVSSANTKRMEAAAALSTEISLLDERLSEVKRHAVDLRELAGGSFRGDPSQLEEERSVLFKDRHARQGEYVAASDEMARVEARLELAKQQQLKHQDGRCFACHQEIPEVLLKAQERELGEVSRLATEARTACRLQIQQASESMREIDARLREISAVLDRAVPNQIVNEKLAALKERFETNRFKLISSKFDLDLLEEEAEAARYALDVLGLQGMRANILNGALASLGRHVNTYLGWLGTASTVEMSGAYEQVNGKVVNKIMIQVHGIGGGHGYDAGSSGERRRIDMAFLLGIAGLSESRGTLIFDEAFDGPLDVAGVEAVAELLARVAETRPVVVITHNHHLFKKLPGEVLDISSR